MKNFSFYKKGITSLVPSLEVSVQSAIDRIRGEIYKEDVLRLRQATDKSVQSVIKRGLDYFTFSGTFKSRSEDKLIAHSGIICLDFDPYKKQRNADPILVNPRLINEFEKVRAELENDKYSLAVFTSPSGTGYKLLVKINGAVHLDSYLALHAYFAAQYDLFTDESGKDIPRACFVSYDPEAYYNPESELFLPNRSWPVPGGYGHGQTAQPFPSEAKPVKIPATDFNASASLKQAFHVVKQIVEHSMDITQNYDDWRDIGFSLSTYGEDGRELFHQVSQFHPEYDRKMADRRFDEALQKSRFTTPAKFFQIAKDCGVEITLPKTDDAPAQPTIDKSTAPEIPTSKRDAAPGEDEGQLFPEVRKSFTDEEIESVLSVNTRKFLKFKHQLKDEADKAYAKIAARFKEQRWFSLESFSEVLNRSYITYTATNEFPMFMIDEGEHKLIYMPYHPDKNSRFRQFGKKPKDFIHGLKSLEEKYDANKKRIEEEEMERGEMEGEDDGKKKKKEKKEDPRLEEVVFCRGCSDAINLAMLGYTVIWMDKPTAKPSKYQYDQQLKNKVQRLFQMTTLDRLGKRVLHSMAMDYLDVINIELPEQLVAEKDLFGDPCRDVRDYLNHFKEYDFKMLVETAIPYRFWEKSYDRNGVNYSVSNTLLYNFLHKNGFWKMRIGDKKSDAIYVRIQGNTVTEVDGSDIRSFIKLFLRERMVDRALKDAVFNTTKVNDTSLSQLDETDIDFTDFDKNTQFIFFGNKTVEVTKDGVKVHRPGEVSKYVWDEELHRHQFELLKKEPFSITQDTLGQYDITINNPECLFLKYLVQTSRVHWRNELEGDRFRAKSEEEKTKYLQENHCNIAGPLLDQDEIAEQKLHLVNKIFAIGYHLHRYKDRKKPWFCYGMDDKISEDGRSHGGSGKSIFFDMAIRSMLTKNFYINGRNTKLNDDPHKYDGLTEHDRYILIDDAHQFLRLDLFFTDITGDIKVNPKGKKPYAIPFDKGGKFAFTSNYPPRNIDSSILRRLLYVVFSDYYHTAGETNDYKETRDPGTDLGKTLFKEFTREEWNHFYNTMIYCLRFFLSTTEKISPAMGNVTKKNLLAAMGFDFHGWAMVYFSEESDRLDKFIHRQHAYQDYKRDINNKMTPQGFLDRLKAFCTLYGYILNPKPFLTGRDKKSIIRKETPTVYDPVLRQWRVLEDAKKVATELLYIQTTDQLPTAVPEDDDMPF